MTRISNLQEISSIAADDVFVVEDVSEANVTRKVKVGSFLTDTQVFYAIHQKTQGADGGTFTAGSWVQRQLNTNDVNTITGASLISNQIRLPAGTYEFYSNHTAHSCGKNQARLYNVTDGFAQLRGTINDFPSGVGGTAEIKGTFTLGGIKVLEIQHQGELTVGTTGFGEGAGFDTEIYSNVMIRKVL